MIEKHKHPRVVIIDDEESIRYSFNTFLTNDGYQVWCADTLKAGLDLITAHFPDIIFTDIILGDENGLKVLEKVNELKLHSPVIMITGQPSIDTATDAVRLGAYDYMVKPIIKDSLLRVARSALKNKQLIDEKEKLTAEKERYRNHLEAVFASVNDAIITIDNTRRIIASNAAATSICHTDSNKLNGCRIHETDNPCLMACLDIIESSLKKREAIRVEKKAFTHTDGAPMVISITCSPLLSSHQRSLGAALVIKDITRLNYLEHRMKQEAPFAGIIGNSLSMHKVYDLIRALADTDATVLITGESGTGKNMVAREIHGLSARCEHNMVTVRCSALSENLLESELFGHVKGAFTGAVKDKVGRFQLCDKGSIFLDEIGEITPKLQLKLLSVIQDREFERVGDATPIHVDTRIIAATNKNLKEEVRQERFREDLYYRLNVVEIKMPPLKERHGDIPLLVAHFITRFQERYKKDITGVSTEVMQLFCSYAWPGNIRELEHAIEHAFVLCRGTLIEMGHIPSEIQDSALPCQGQGNTSPSMEKKDLVNTLEKTGWNKARTARIMGISRPTLYRKLEKYQLEDPPPEKE